MTCCTNSNRDYVEPPQGLSPALGLMNILSSESRRILSALLFALCTAVTTVHGAEATTAETPDSTRVSLWEGEVGDGFRKGAHEVDLSVAAGLGMPILGSKERHQWVLGVADYGWVFSDVVAKDHWYQGNWELLGDLFGGIQYHPDHAFLVGVAPLLRYNFATGTRWVPFVNAGAGVTATDIRDGDLSTKFEFNLQIGAGVHYFLKDNLALTLQYRFLHISDAGISSPNLGVNDSNVVLGASWFF